MDEFVKSVVEHIMGKETSEASQEYRKNDNYEEKSDLQASIYRPNYQRQKKSECNIRTGTFICVDTEPHKRKSFTTEKSSNGLEEDLRWLRLTARREV